MAPLLDVSNSMQLPVRRLEGYIWRFSDSTFDGLRMELRRGEKEVKLEPKPLLMLHLLLSRAGEVITKQELLDSVWPEESVVEGVLTTNINKLRDAIKDEEKKIILTVRGIGYKFACSVQWEKASSTIGPIAEIREGSSVPGRDQWRLQKRLDQRLDSDGVWLAQHKKTHDVRVFKFAQSVERLHSLKREVTVSRLLHRTQTSQPEFVRVLEWNFDTLPFFLESEYGGINLPEWAEAQGGLEKVPLPTRLAILIATAKAVAKAHDFGILHKDLKPANILIGGGEPLQVRLVDFGSGVLLNPEKLRELDISDPGKSAEEREELGGTLLYCAPELLEGNPPTASSDVYALGILLYQTLRGNFRKSLSPGWESFIPDPLLREDIAAAANGDPARRILTAAEFFHRLETLEERRLQFAEVEQAKARAADAERKLAAFRAKRPWMIAASVLLISGLLTTTLLYIRAIHEQNRANYHASVSEAIDRFLAQDLLGRTSPLATGKKDESLLGAVRQALPDIDRQFGNQPLIAAQLHSIVAQSLWQRDDIEGALQQFTAAADSYQRVQGSLSQDAIIERLKAAQVLSKTFLPSNIEKAKQILSAQKALVAQIKNPKPEIALYTAMSNGYIIFSATDIPGAIQQFQTAQTTAEATPTVTERDRARIKHMLAASYMRLGDAAKAEPLCKDVMESYARLYGKDSPSLLQVQLTLAQIFFSNQRYKEAIALTTAIYPNFVKVYGDANQLSLQVLATRASSEAALEQWDGAIQDEMAIHKISLKNEGSLGLFSTLVFSDLALIQCQAGKYSEGLSNALQAQAKTKKAFANRKDFDNATDFAVAFCQLGQGKYKEAGALLSQIDAEAVAALAADNGFPGDLALAKTQVAQAKGDSAEAKHQFAIAEQVFQKRPPTAFQKHWIEKMRAEVAKSS